MKQKSRLILFMLSFVPGLSHLYLGLKDRALIFLAAFFGMIIGVVGLCALTGNGRFLIILVFALPFIWLIALLDAFSAKGKISPDDEIPTELSAVEHQKMMQLSNRKTIALIFSVVPGAGHMYLGLQKKGLYIMTIFFFAVFFMGWLNISLFLFILPVIWFYSFFDAFHLVNKESCSDEKIELPAFLSNPKWIGWALIGFGLLIVLERIVYPLIPWEIQRYMQTLIVAVIFIFGGIKLLVGNKKKNQKEVDDLCQKDE